VVVELPRLISVEDFLSGVDLVPLPDLTWGQAREVLAGSGDAETHVTVVGALARNLINSCSVPGREGNAIPGREANEVLAGSPVARWAAMTLLDYDAAAYAPLDVHRFVAATDTPRGGDALVAMHLWGTAGLCHEGIQDPFGALDACGAFLELSQGRGWTRPDFDIARIVLDAAVEGQSGPIGPVGEELMRKWEQRLVGAVEGVDPDFAYTEHQLLRAWRS